MQYFLWGAWKIVKFVRQVMRLTLPITPSLVAKKCTHCYRIDSATFPLALAMRH